MQFLAMALDSYKQQSPLSGLILRLIGCFVLTLITVLIPYHLDERLLQKLRRLMYRKF
jgi:hypothetical protein